MGKHTMEAIDSSQPLRLLAAMRSEQAGYYRSIIAEKPNMKEFETGWLNRAYS